MTNLNIRLKEKEKGFWQRAAEIEDRSMSSWVRFHLNECARDAILKRQKRRSRDKQFLDGGE